MRNFLSRLSYSLRIGIALVASVLLLAGSPALGSNAECRDEWDESSASETCNNVNIAFGDWQGCQPCCSIVAKCHTGNRLSLNPWKSTIIVVPVSEVSDLENCRGTLTEGSC